MVCNWVLGCMTDKALVLFKTEACYEELIGGGFFSTSWYLAKFTKTLDLCFNLYLFLYCTLLYMAFKHKFINWQIFIDFFFSAGGIFCSCLYRAYLRLACDLWPPSLDHSELKCLLNFPEGKDFCG